MRALVIGGVAAAVAAGGMLLMPRPGGTPVDQNVNMASTVCAVSPAGLKPGGSVVTPITGRYLVSSDFGARWGTNHNGIDLAAPTNVPTLAAAAGTVTFAGWAGGAGNMVQIDNGNGITTVYMHHSSIVVKQGQAVQAGQQLGVQGTTGDSTGPHLHFEVHVNGTPVEPRAWLAKAGVTIPPMGSWGDGGGRVGSAVNVAAPPICDPGKSDLRESAVPAEYLPWVLKAGAICEGYPASIVAAQIETESGWKPRAVSPAGAAGLSQFMPGTWAGIGKDDDGNGKVSPYDPGDAIMAQGRYGCQMLTLVKGVPGDKLDLALAAYNAGPGEVLAAGGIPPYAETRAYVPKIRGLAATKYGKVGAGS